MAQVRLWFTYINFYGWSESFRDCLRLEMLIIDFFFQINHWTEFLLLYCRESERWTGSNEGSISIMSLLAFSCWIGGSVIYSVSFCIFHFFLPWWFMNWIAEYLPIEVELVHCSGLFGRIGFGSLIWSVVTRIQFFLDIVLMLSIRVP